MLSEIFTACGCSTDQTICSRAQPSRSLHKEEQETDNDGERNWLSDVNDTEQWDLEEKMQHVLLYGHQSDADESGFFFPSSLFCSFFHLYSHFLFISRWPISHCRCICVCPLHFFSLSSLHRPETRFEQAESQWQWHSQRPDRGWVYTQGCVWGEKCSLHFESKWKLFASLFSRCNHGAWWWEIQTKTRNMSRLPCSVFRYTLQLSQCDYCG